MQSFKDLARKNFSQKFQWNRMLWTIALSVVKSIYNIKESDEVLPMSYRWNDQVYITIPNINGKTKKEVKQLLKGLKIEFLGDGNVIDSNPIEGTRVKMGSTIKILLN